MQVMIRLQYTILYNAMISMTCLSKKKKSCLDNTKLLMINRSFSYLIWFFSILDDTNYYSLRPVSLAVMVLRWQLKRLNVFKLMLLYKLLSSKNIHAKKTERYSPLIWLYYWLVYGLRYKLTSKVKNCASYIYLSAIINELTT